MSTSLRRKLYRFLSLFNSYAWYHLLIYFFKPLFEYVKDPADVDNCSYWLTVVYPLISWLGEKAPATIFGRSSKLMLSLLLCFNGIPVKIYLNNKLMN